MRAVGSREKSKVGSKETGKVDKTLGAQNSVPWPKL